LTWIALGISQLLINALTVQVKSAQIPLSGNPTYQELTLKRRIGLEFKYRNHEQTHWAFRWLHLHSGVRSTRSNNARKIQCTAQKPKAGPGRLRGSRLDDSPALVLGPLSCDAAYWEELIWLRDLSVDSLVGLISVIRSLHSFML
jgi:hypothetical protein